MAKVAIIHKKNGRPFECPIHAVSNFRRMIGDQIERVEIKSDAPAEAAPSVVPEEDAIIEHPAANTPEEKNEATPVENTDDKDGDTPNVRWSKTQLQEYLRENHPDIEFQANDTKAMLLNFIKAASK